jgi:Sulfotransferase family
MPDMEDPGSDRPKLVFLHMPKTGGTSLHRTIAAAFAPGEICPERLGELHRYSAEELARYRFFSGHYDFDDIARIPGRKFVFTVLRPPKERVLSLYRFWRRHTAEFIEAHAPAGPRFAREHGLLEFLRSASEPPRGDIDNFVARRLAGSVEVTPEGAFTRTEDGRARPISGMEVVELALRNLRSLDLVGFADRLDDTYAGVAAAFGLPPVERLPRLNTRHELRAGLEPAEMEPVTPEVDAELNRLTDLDRMVYRLARHHGRPR